MGGASLILAFLLASSTAPAGGVDVDSLDSWVPRDPSAAIRLTPHAILFDPLGRLWILDRTRGRVMRVEAGGAGPSFGISGDRRYPISGATDFAASGTFLYFLDPTNRAILLMDLDGSIRERIDLEDEIARARAEGFIASRILVGRSGDLWLIESRSGEIIRFDRRGRWIDAPLASISAESRPLRATDVASGPDDTVYVLDAPRSTIFAISDQAAPLPPIRFEGPVVEPASLAVDGQSRIFVLDAGGRLRVLLRDGGLLFDGPVSGLRGETATRAAIRDSILYAAVPAKGVIRRLGIRGGIAAGDARR